MGNMKTLHNPINKTLLGLVVAALTIGCNGTGLSIGSDSEESNSSIENSNNITDNSVDNSDNRINEAEDENQPDSSDSGSDGENPECSEEIQGVDGEGDFLWKPEGVNGLPVILFPDDYEVKFEKVLVEQDSGDLEEAVFTGFANGGRQHWRLKKEASEYTGRIVVQDEAQECIWKIENTEERQD